MEKQQETVNNNRRSATRKGVYAAQALLGWGMSFVIAVLFLVFVFGVCLRPVRIEGMAMEPLLCEGEVVLVDYVSKHIDYPQRGDAVLFRDPLGTGLLVRRIVALPGEEVTTLDGRLFLGGCPVDESAYATTDCPQDLGNESVTVPEGAVFVMGDNRIELYDSRCPEIGCISYSEILGIVRLRIYPVRRANIYW